MLSGSQWTMGPPASSCTCECLTSCGLGSGILDQIAGCLWGTIRVCSLFFLMVFYGLPQAGGAGAPGAAALLWPSAALYSLKLVCSYSLSFPVPCCRLVVLVHQVLLLCAGPVPPSTL